MPSAIDHALRLLRSTRLYRIWGPAALAGLATVWLGCTELGLIVGLSKDLRTVLSIGAILINGVTIAWTVWQFKGEPEWIADLHQAEQQVEALQQKERQSADLITALRKASAREAAIESLTQSMLDHMEWHAASRLTDPRPALGRMLALLAQYRQRLLEVEEAETWTLSVYLPLPGGSVLSCEGMRYPLSPSLPRTWAPGIGQVGATFISTTPIIADDTSRPELAHLFNVGGNRKPDDERRYRSIASVQLSVDGVTRGVLIATSDRVGRFGYAPQGATVSAAAAIPDNVRVLALVAEYRAVVVASQ